MEVFSLFATLSLRAEGFYGGLDRAMRRGTEFAEHMRQLALRVEALESEFDRAGGSTSALGDNLVNGLARAVPRFTQTGSRMVSGLIGGMAQMSGLVSDAGENINQSLLSGIYAGNPRLLRLMRDIVGMCAKALGTDRISEIVSAGNNILPALMRGINSNTAGARNEMDSIGRNLVDSMSGGIAGAASRAVNAARNVAQSVANTVKDVLGIQSPSRVFREIGENVGEGFVQGLEVVSPKVGRAVGDVFGNIGIQGETLRVAQGDSKGVAPIAAGSTVINQYFYGVREEKTAWEAYRAVKKCY
jgi:phage-related protein